LASILLKKVKKNTWFLLILIILAGFLVFTKPYFGWRLYGFFNPPLDNNSEEAKKLVLENENLKAEIAKSDILRSALPEGTMDYLDAFVYSRYPFNFKNELLVSVGAKDGVARGGAAVFGGTLVGQVEDVFDNTSAVITVFDSRLKLPVRIGKGATQALLQGGSSPSAILIPREADVAPGDVVYSASPYFPYGLPVGEIGEVKISSDRLFKEATIKFGYDINALSAVLIEKTKNK